MSVELANSGLQGRYWKDIPMAHWGLSYMSGHRAGLVRS